jgi:hypothetical protein
MFYRTTSRIFQATAILGLIGCGLVLTMQMNWIQGSTAGAGEAPKAIDFPVASIQSYPAQQTKGKLRVSLLGVTKGVAFLDSQEPAIDGGRKHGENAITWLRAAVLVERLGDEPQAIASVGFEFRGPDGEGLVEEIKYKLAVDTKPVVVDGHGSGVAFVDLRSGRLSHDFFPVAPPHVEKPDQAIVVLATQSGRILATRTATLLVRIGNDDARQEFLFENLPMP